MCELFEDIDDTDQGTLRDSLVVEQKKLIDNIKAGGESDIVRLPKCKGLHLFHKECVKS